MSSAELSSGQLREYLHELSGAVARRLSSVVERARDLPEQKAIPLDRVALEVAGIQRTIMNELVGSRPLRRDALSAMLDLELDALKLLDKIETFLWHKEVLAPASGLGNGSVPQVAAHSRFAPDGASFEAAVQLFQAAIARQQSEGLSYLSPRSDQVTDPVAGYQSGVAGDAPPYAADLEHAAWVAAPENTDHGSVAYNHANTSNFYHQPAYTEGPLQFQERSPNTSRALAIRRPTEIAVLSRAETLKRHAYAWGRQWFTPWSVAAASGLLSGVLLVMFALSGEPASAPVQSNRVAVKGDKLEGRLGRVMVREQSNTSARATVALAATATADNAAADPAPSSYVAVIATVAEPPAAQKALTHVLGKYPAEVGAVTEAEVEAVKAPDGTMWYRTYLLPALPQPAAKDLCRRLRKAGHSACWVKLHG